MYSQERKNMSDEFKLPSLRCALIIVCCCEAWTFDGSTIQQTVSVKAKQQLCYKNLVALVPQMQSSFSILAFLGAQAKLPNDAGFFALLNCAVSSPSRPATQGTRKDRRTP